MIRAPAKRDDAVAVEAAWRRGASKREAAETHAEVLADSPSSGRCAHGTVAVVSMPQKTLSARARERSTVRKSAT